MPASTFQVNSGSPTSLATTILNGGSLSSALKVDGKMLGVIIPAAWTAGAITFQASQDGVNFFDLYDAGTERTIASANVVANRFIHLTPADWLSVNFVKLRSGISATPVAQGADRIMTVVMAG